MKKTALKTITLTIGDDPSHVVCPGHVDIKTFNQAFKNEGWDSVGHYKKDEISYIYAVKQEANANGRFKFKEVAPNSPGAKKFTISRWD